MRRSAIVIALVVPAAFMLLSPGRCAAWDPGGQNSTIPGMIRLVGHDGRGTPDPIGLFTVTVRDLANDPVRGAKVDVDFSSCPDALLSSVQESGITVVCAARTVSAFTDAAGRVTMSLIGSARSGLPANGPAKIYADGVLLGSVDVSMFDLDGSDGVHGSDLAAWAADFVSGTNPARSNFDGVGLVGGGDLAWWAGVFIKGTSILGARSLEQNCP